MADEKQYQSRFFALPSKEKIEEYRKWTPLQKLTWLAEAQKFYYMALDEKALKNIKFFKEYRPD